MRLSVVGGGSTYTPELVDGIIRLAPVLGVEELRLHDRDAQRLAIVGGLARRMLDRAASPTILSTGTDLDAAVEGADAVLIQLRVGGQAARAEDERLPLACGCIGQETTGFGGLAKALRTVPVVLEVARRVRARAPQAWIVDFTNPVGIVTRALLDEGHRAVGLCSSAAVFQRHFARVLGAAPESIELDHVGLNHLTWEIGVRRDGREVLGELLGEHLEQVAPASGLPPATISQLGAVPSYYLHYFYEHDRVVEYQRTHASRAEEVAVIEAELLERYGDERVVEKPALLSRRGGAFYSEAALELLASLFGEPGRNRHVVNVANGGTFAFLSPEAVIEVPATVAPDGVTPAGPFQLDPLFAGLVAHVSAYESLALDAARVGGRTRVFRALLAHPLIGQSEYAERLTDSLIAANRDFLPWA